MLRKMRLLSSVLFITPFVLSSNVFAADCVTQNCPTLGYTSASNTGNCVKCPFGNYWACPKNNTSNGGGQSGGGGNSGDNTNTPCTDICIRYQVAVKFECDEGRDGWHLSKIYHDFYVQKDGTLKEDTGGYVSTNQGTFNTSQECEAAYANRGGELYQYYESCSERGCKEELR